MSNTNSPDEKQAPSEIVARLMYGDNEAGRLAAEHLAAALAEAGYKIVAREPSEAMLAIGPITECEWLDIHQDEVPDLWRAMWDAAE